MQLNNFLLNINRPFAHFKYDSKILSMFLWELFPFNAEESVPFHAKFNEKNEYFPHIHILCTKCKCCETTCKLN